MNMAKYAAEGLLLVGSAVLCFVVLLPIFQINQTLRGNPFWFIPWLDKSRR